MNHEEALLQIPDFDRGRLPRHEAWLMMRHLVECADCREQLSVCRLLRRGVGGDANGLLDAHPTSDEIDGLAADPSELGWQRLARISAHVEQCGTCQGETEASRRAAAHAPHGVSLPWEHRGPKRRFVRLDRWTWLPALSAGAAFCAVVGRAAYDSVVRLPAARSQVSTIESENKALKGQTERLLAEYEAQSAKLRNAEVASAGGFALNMLRESLRAVDAPVTVVLEANDRGIVLTFAPAVPPFAAGATQASIRVVDEAGHEAWSTRVALDHVRRLQKFSDGVLAVRIPSGALQPGRYTLHWAVPSQAPPATYPFLVAAPLNGADYRG